MAAEPSVREAELSHFFGHSRPDRPPSGSTLADRLRRRLWRKLLISEQLAGSLADRPELAARLAQASLRLTDQILQERARAELTADDTWSRQQDQTRAELVKVVRLGRSLDELAALNHRLDRLESNQRDHRRATLATIGEELDSLGEPLVDQILELRRRLLRADATIRDLGGEAGWDGLSGLWQRLDWTGLETAAAALARFPELREVAALIGRGQTEQDQSTLTEARRHPSIWEPLGTEELVGYRTGNNLEWLLPQELALLADPQTATLFWQRLTDRQLLIRDYRTRGLKANPPELRGPIILCLDTSGSMAGQPEELAKALALAFAQWAKNAGRACYLIAFSTQVTTFDLGELGLAGLADFLDHSFHGGTDLRPALAESLAALERSPYQKADLLVVSDFQIPKILIKKAALIQPLLAAQKARIHGLSINQEGLRDSTHLFDTAWHFQLDRRGEPQGIALLRRGA